MSGTGTSYFHLVSRPPDASILSSETLASESTTRYHESSRRLMPSIESNQLLLAAAAACEDKKAEDIRILALDPAESGLTDYFLICNGTNERQNVAITDEVELRLKREFGVYPNSVEGRRQGEWILMDYVDFIVHVFSAEKRAFYGLERLRKSATTISVADLTAELKAVIAKARAKAAKPAAIRKVPAKRAVAKKTSPMKSSPRKVKKN
jgi:ribosome-associated protein